MDEEGREDVGPARAFDEGALSAVEYGELVAATIESEREPPDPGVGPEE